MWVNNRSKLYDTVVKDVMKLLSNGRNRYPVFNAWSHEDQKRMLLEILNEKSSTEIWVKYDECNEPVTFAVIMLETDLHVGPTVSVVCNYSIAGVNDYDFQKRLIRYVKSWARKEGFRYAAYTHMHKDGKGCDTRYIEA